MTALPNNRQRILSIDAFRGITILVMVFVNEVAGVRDVPGWMKHVAADADAMTFVDVVFPAFLFIVGMSVPFALQTRRSKGDSFWQLQLHILWRTAGLLVLGVFMVNAEQGIHEKATGISGAWWSLLFYICMIMVWNVYTFQQKTWSYLLRIAGAAGLIVLAIIYRSGEDGTQRMGTHWWGILGLIGWAYLYSSIIYQLLRGNQLGLLVTIAGCIAFYSVSKTEMVRSHAFLNWMGSQAGNLAHTSIVLCGVLLSRILFAKNTDPAGRKLKTALLFTLLLFIAGWLLRPYFGISKIYATPSWCLYSAGICCIIFGLLYWLIDIRGIHHWTHFFRPAATNPLLTYIIPGIWYALLSVLGWTVFPWAWRYGLPGIGWALFFAVAVMYMVRGLNKLRIRLQL